MNHSGFGDVYLIKFALRDSPDKRGDNENVSSYLIIQAIKKVMAGSILLIAAAKVAVVYFIPKK